MQEGGENLKDTVKDTIKDIDPALIPRDFPAVLIGSYNKTDRLITALYLVTDIMDKEEPIRGRLRTLGSMVLSDAYSISASYRTSDSPVSSAVLNMRRKIMELVSLLEISSFVGMVSEMNAGILKREFLELNGSLEDSAEKDSGWLEKFLTSSEEEKKEISASSEKSFLDTPKNHTAQKQNITENVRKKPADSKGHVSDKNLDSHLKDMDYLKGQRRLAIINIVKTMPEGATISDIRFKASGTLRSCGEKTLQRELLSMLGDGVLKKEGEKRWSRYFVNN